MNRHHHAISLQQATSESPVLARLTDLARDSGARLKAIENLLPEALRPAIRPGPIDDGAWCLLVSNNAAASKLRQLIPSLTAHLRAKGWEVTAIRLKVQANPNR
ncbi:MAG: hypothetical protein CVU30_01605 [Betaproteobacteria bacterium HGW-Betaproteobacteria-3]|jgi:hypothetical protein|nr:MAG: hypothetical protein CVU30_01605 [Betaproteobacteria bacterium HGW-Betaproteobacteria-3]